MRENKTKARLAAGETVVGCFLRYAEPSLAEFVALQGWDFLVFDGEHGPLEPRDVQDLCRAADVRGVTPIVRVPTNQPHILLRYMDTGAQGVHVPWVNSAADADTAVQGIKYGPRGLRGLAGTRASDWGMTGPLGEYTKVADRETLVVIHIETTEAVDAIEDYVAVDGIDVLFLGPTDLSQSLGVPGQVQHPDVEAAMRRVAEVVANSEKALGLFASTIEVSRKWQQYGARYIATGIDGFLRNGMHEFLERVRA